MLGIISSFGEKEKCFSKLSICDKHQHCISKKNLVAIDICQLYHATTWSKKKNTSQGLRHTGDTPALPLPFKRTLCELTPGAVTPGLLVPLWLVCLRSLLVTRCACRWQRRGLRSGAHALCVATHTHIHTENWFFTHVEVLSHSIYIYTSPVSLWYLELDRDTIAHDWCVTSNSSAAGGIGMYIYVI